MDILRVLCSFLCGFNRPELLRGLPSQTPLEFGCPVHPYSEPILHGGNDRQLLRHRDSHYGSGHHGCGLLHCGAFLTTEQIWLHFLSWCVVCVPDRLDAVCNSLHLHSSQDIAHCLCLTGSSALHLLFGSGHSVASWKQEAGLKPRGIHLCCSQPLHWHCQHLPLHFVYCRTCPWIGGTLKTDESWRNAPIKCCYCALSHTSSTRCLFFVTLVWFQQMNKLYSTGDNGTCFTQVWIIHLKSIKLACQFYHLKYM